MEFSLGKVKVRPALVNHPGICAGYRVCTSAGSIAFIPDHEPFELFLHSLRGNRLSPAQAKQIAIDKQAGLVRFLHGSDILIIDAQYTDGEYKAHIGWGHSSISSTVSLALEAEVQTLVLFHHDPHHDDEKVDAMLESARDVAAKSERPLDIIAAREGSEILLEAKIAA